jgi:hypothetical protein
LIGNSIFRLIDLIGFTTRPASHADVLATSASTVSTTNVHSAFELPLDILKELVPSDVAPHTLPPLPPPCPHHPPTPPIDPRNLAEVAPGLFVLLKDLPHLILLALILFILPSSVVLLPQTMTMIKRMSTMAERMPTCAMNTLGQELITRAWVGDSKATRGVMLRLSPELSLCLFFLSFCLAYRLYFVFTLYHRPRATLCLFPRH